jgi:hypothetical protein
MSQISEESLEYAVHASLGACNLSGGGSKPYNFRCPICGDSKKNQFKKRGFVLQNDEGWTYICHNECGSMSFINFLKQYHPQVYQEMIFRSFSSKKKGPRKTQPKEITDPNKDHKANVFKPGELISVLDPTNEMAIKGLEYCLSRQIRRKVYEKWFVCLEDDKFHDKYPNGEYVLNGKGYPSGNEYHSRLIIPYYRFGGSWVQFDARALEASALRYRNLEGAKREYYNVDWLDVNRPFFMLEGAINSTFIENAVAFGGTEHFDGFIQENPQVLKNAKNGILIFDNDDAGKIKLQKVMKYGFSWFNWKSIKIDPAAASEGNIIKDINDLVRFGKDVELDDKGYVKSEWIKKYVEGTGATEVLFTLQYGDMQGMQQKRVESERFRLNI